MLFYDFEVFKHDWLVVVMDMTAKKTHVIINSPEELEALYKANVKEIWCGFNSRHYDQYILKAILCGFDPKKVNDYIIVKGNPGWKFSSLFRQFPLYNYDVMLGTDRGLKSFEGFMGNDIKESSVPFDIDRKLTEEEIAETVKYCKHDVENTIQVFLKRVEEFNTMLYFIKHFELPFDYISKTKAQLAAEILGGNRMGEEFDDEFQFPILECLDLKKYRHIADWYRNPENHDYSKKQKDEIVAGVPHVFAWGGGHGARAKFHASGVFIIIDVTAYYPSLQKKYKFGYRVMNHPENFEFIHDSNIEFKRKGDKKARQPFKIMDNAISGQMKQRSSALYDPMSNNSICINGQLLLLDLVEHIEPYCELIQNNTDGIIVKLKDYERDFDKLDDIVYEWEQRTGMKMDFDTFIGDIYQKDVNNYLSKLMNKYIPEDLTYWLIEKGFFKAPASIHHHGAYTGALFDHSFAVTKALLSLTERLELKWQLERSPYIVGMFHDLCKIDNYTRSDNEAWEYNNAALLPGHGEKSVILLQQHIQLTDEEMLCIRWHMGAFDDKENWNSYGRSVTNYPNVLYTHTADMIAARVLGV